MIDVRNIFEELPDDKSSEIFQSILSNDRLNLERIITNGQTTPPGEWYDQDHTEWVLLLKGSASLRFEDGSEIDLKPGDYITIDPHKKHRVEKVDQLGETIWLALHYK